MVKIKFLDLGRQPIANRFLNKDEFENEFFYNLSVGYDPETFLVTQMNYIDAPMMFNDTYAYRGSMSQTMRTHFLRFSCHMKDEVYKNHTPKVLEIGSNDGVFIKNWDKKTTFAVEPCGNFAEETNEMGYKTYAKFWNMDTSNEILEDQGKMDLVFSANCMCHIPDIDSAFKAVENILSDDGLFIFEDPSLLSMMLLNTYDQIYDEHAHIFSVTALKKILERNNLCIVDVEQLFKIHGGSNRIYAKKISNNKPNDSVSTAIQEEKREGLNNGLRYRDFADDVDRMRRALVKFVNWKKNQNKKIISYGATSKSTTIFNYCKIGPDLIDYITDTTPEKQGKYSPGMHIPIISPEEGFNNSVDYALLGAWNFAKEIKKKEQGFTGRFFTHAPSVQTI